MVHILKTKNRIFIFIFLVSLLFSCDKDTELLSDHVLDEGQIAALDDNFRIPAHRTSVLDVLSNDSYISSANTRIIDITPPSSGRIRINEDNTITYIPENVTVEESPVAPAPKEVPAPEKTTEASNTDVEDPSTDGDGSTDQETPEEEVATVDPISMEPDLAETTPEENVAQETTVEETVQEETTTETATTEETPSQETPSQETNAPEAPSKESAPVANTSQENETEEKTSEETSTEENNNSENATSDTGETSTENTPTEAEEATAEIDQEDDSPSIAEPPTEENIPEDTTIEDTPIEEIQEDTFTYTTETEDEDGTVTTETATVTVEVETETETQAEAVPETNSSSETDYWRDAVVAGSHLLDEKYYDLDTGEIYSKEVNLQRGQVENYIEHENCPQRLKDKWDGRIEVSPSDVNGSQDGLQKVFDAHPEGSLFYLRAGTYQDQKNAVLKRNQDVVGASGALLDGSGIQGNSEDATRAIRSAEGGYIANLKVREYPTWKDPQNPRNPRGAALETIQNGAILNCEVHSHNKALSVVYGSKAMWNKFTAGRLGIYGYGSHDPNSPNRRGSVVKYNEWYDCNFNGYDGEHEAGGAKFVQVDGTLWSHNYIHDIPSGAGIWQDGDNRDSEVYNNVIIKTHRAIFSELSHTSNIHHNTVEYGTGFGAIYMSNAQDEKAHHNFIRWCRNGITVRDKERGTSRIYPGKAWRGINNEINNNYIWQRPDPSTWTHGMLTLFDGHIDPNNTSNKWHDNHYYVDDNAEGAVLLSEQEPYSKVLMYCKTGAAADHKTISFDEWKKKSGDKNSTLEYQRFF